MNISVAVDMAIQEMEKHGLFARGWTFEWDNAKRRFGMCSYQRKVITMSRPLVELNTEEEMRDTLLHEIAHALVGPGHSHDMLWRFEARKVGARPIACYDSADILTPTPKFIGTCQSCGKEVKRFRMTKRVSNQAFHVACRQAGKEAKIEWRKV